MRRCPAAAPWRATEVLTALTKSRSASYHRRSMIKVLAIGACLYVLWEPIRPIRQVTADVLAYAAEQISR